MSSKTRLHGVLVTFRRPADLAVTLRRLAGQTRRLDRLIVVDNNADRHVNELVTAHPDAASIVEYLPAPDNLGPAGGLALGCSRVLRAAADHDWVMFFDDDNPPRTARGVQEIVEFASDMVRCDPSIGGVGLVGARFNARSGLMERVADRDLRGPVEVTYVGGGQLPCYNVTAMQEVGVPNANLFFGFDDLDYGLRFGAAGRKLYVNGAKWARERQVFGLIGNDKSPSRRLDAVGWRDYYSTRNLVWILRSRGHHVAAARVLARSILAKAVYNLPRDPRAAWSHFARGARAALDAYTGRMGRTVDPVPSRLDGVSR